MKKIKNLVYKGMLVGMTMISSVGMAGPIVENAPVYAAETTNNYWIAKGYSYAGHSKYFKTQEAATSYWNKNKEALRKKYGSYSFAYMINANSKGYFLSYYTKAK